MRVVLQGCSHLNGLANHFTPIKRIILEGDTRAMNRYLGSSILALVSTIAAACAAGEPTREAQFVPNEFATSIASDSERSPEDHRRLMTAALRESLVGEATSVEAMGASGDPSYIPVLVELQRFPWYLDSSSWRAIGSSLVKLGQGYGEEPVPDGRDWEGWVSWLGTHPEVMPPGGFAAWKGQLFTTLIDPKIGDFFYDEVKTRIRLEEIVWGGVTKDGIPDLRYAPVVEAPEASYLNASDRVFGVSINGKHRAYPLRILNAHEMANDVVGGVPIALAY